MFEIVCQYLFNSYVFIIIVKSEAQKNVNKIAYSTFRLMFMSYIAGASAPPTHIAFFNINYKYLQSLIFQKYVFF